MFEPPSKKFAQLEPDEQKYIRVILEQQPAVRASPLTGEEREDFIQQLIGFVDNGMARIVLHEDQSLRLEIFPGVAEAIKQDLGVS